MSAHRILLVEDDENLRLALADNLRDAGHVVDEAATAADAEAAWSAGGYGLVVLDVMLPDGDGYTLCRTRRGAGDQTPVLMLTARSLEDDLVRGFSEGADDYLAKPYRLRELMARVAALLRRAPRTASDEVHFGDFELRVSGQVVHGPQGPVGLTRRQFDVLATLVAREGETLSRNDLLDLVWGEVLVDIRTVDNFVSAVKRKLDWKASDPWRIRTVWGMGYRFERERASTEGDTSS